MGGFYGVVRITGSLEGSRKHVQKLLFSIFILQKQSWLHFYKKITALRFDIFDNIADSYLKLYDCQILFDNKYMSLANAQSSGELNPTFFK